MSWYDTAKTCRDCKNIIHVFELETDYGKLKLCSQCHFKMQLEQLEKRSATMREFNDLFKTASENRFSDIDELGKILTFIQKHEVSPKEAFERIRGELLLFIESEDCGEITERITTKIERLKKQLNLSPEFMQSVEDEVDYLTQILKVRKGILPTETFVSINLPSGEILHYQSSAVYTDSKYDNHEGAIYLTNSRLIFQSWEKSFEFPYNKILNLYVSDSDTTVELSRKNGSGDYSTSQNRLVGEIIDWLVKTSNRQVISKQGSATRYIPQAIKIEVWQRDQGRCVECGAQDYLEFDHVIPFSLGGATSANNLQLLCRKCNLAKRDNL